MHTSQSSSTAQDENEYSEDDEDSDHETNTFDPICPEAQKLDVGSVYGIDLRNPTLLDVLSDRALDGGNSAITALVPVVAIMSMGGNSSAKKDTGGVHLEEY